LSLNLYERGTLDANYPLAGKIFVFGVALVEIS
jgi:FKBP-type peptidyl-prolyl cis-trans isomerase 2